METKPVFSWNDETVALLRNAVLNSFSATEAAGEFAARYVKPPTRSAVIGKAFRLGLSFGVGRAPAAESIRVRQRNHFPWTPRADDKLRECVVNGKSVREIITVMATTFHAAPALTEKAIRARAHKIGVSFARIARTVPSVEPIRIPAPKVSPPVSAQDESGREVDPSPDLPSAISASKGGVALFDLERWMCRFPSGDPRDLDTFRYCGAVVDDGESYCSSCRRRVYTREGLSASALKQLRAAGKARRAAQISATGV